MDKRLISNYKLGFSLKYLTPIFLFFGNLVWIYFMITEDNKLAASCGLLISFSFFVFLMYQAKYVKLFVYQAEDPRYIYMGDDRVEIVHKKVESHLVANYCVVKTKSQKVIYYEKRQ